MTRTIQAIDKDITAVAKKMKRRHPELQQPVWDWNGPAYLAACIR